MLTGLTLMASLTLAGGSGSPHALPSSTDEARALAAARIEARAPAEPTMASPRLPSSTDEARAQAGARLPAPTQKTGPAIPTIATSTDEARGISPPRLVAAKSRPLARAR